MDSQDECVPALGLEHRVVRAVVWSSCFEFYDIEKSGKSAPSENLPA